MTTANNNPFRVSRRLAVAASATPAAGSLAALAASWQQLGRRGAWVGPHGAGKTTQMRHLADHLEREGWSVCWVQWNDDGRVHPSDWRDRLAAANASTLVCLDGSENLGPLAWWRVQRLGRHAGGWLATLHRQGRLPTLRELHLTTAEFARWVQSLVAEEPPETRTRWDHAARQCFAEAEENAHRALESLYRLALKR